MTQTRILVACGLAVAVLATPSIANAQGRQRQATGRAVPRTGPPPRTVVRTYGPVRPVYRSYYYSPYYSPLVGYYGPWAAGYGYPAYAYGYGNPYGYPYAYGGYGYGYPYGRYRHYGGVRIDLPQHDAEVFVDGYYAGVVDDFDGAFQQLNLEPGAHRIEIRAPGFTAVSFEVHIEPGRTITYRSALRP
jgi:hypothetical protein